MTTAGPSVTPRRSPALVVLGALVPLAIDAALLAFALGGVQALLHHPRALGLLAAWAVGGVALALLQPVRTHDPIEVRRDPGYAMPLLFLIPLVIAPLSAWGERHAIAVMPAGNVLGWIGVAISAIGFFIRVAAMARLGSRFSPLVAVQRTHALETSGLYAYVRHPGYLGAWLVSLGAALTFGSAISLPLVIAMLVLLVGRARREEEVLERHFGDEYRGYRERTGGLFPRLRSAGR